MTKFLRHFSGIEGKTCMVLCRSVMSSATSAGSACKQTGISFRVNKDRFCASKMILPLSKFSASVRSYYDVLNVSPAASQEQIKKSYINLSKIYHPDVNRTSEAKQMFQDISEAYAVLGNRNSRNRYNIKIGHSVYNDRPPPTYSRKNRPPPPTGRTKYYNYDEFYRQHYGGYNHARTDQQDYDPYQNRKMSRQEVKIKRFQQACIFTVLCGSAFLMYAMERYKQKRLKRMQQKIKRNNS